MIAPPRMPGATDDDLFTLYERLSSAIYSPIVVQDYPKINDVTMSPDFIARIAEDLPHCRYLKLEDPPLMEKTTAIRQRTDKMKIFGGLGGMFLLEELKRGTSGTMTGFAFTEILAGIFEAFNAGDEARATAIFDHYLPPTRFENQPEINLTIRKELLRRRDAIAHASLREPFRSIDASTHDKISYVLERVGISDPTQRVALKA